MEISGITKPVSIPHRYALNELSKKRKEVEIAGFQFLIGTLQTHIWNVNIAINGVSIPHRYALNLASLIRDFITSPVSIPHRYALNQPLNDNLYLQM